ncbi:MAG TPA: orotidine-5'-phosphate decarboxylase [Candidatus Obscuribacterales bacterium]
MTLSKVSAKDRLIVALDVPTMEEALALVDELQEDVGVFKVGLELFSSCGVALLTELARRGVPVFFDGKFHDIPNTVASASRAIVSHQVKMFNVHAQGGSAMMKAACEAARNAAPHGLKPIVIAVTVLTSISEEILEGELGMSRPLEATVERLAVLAKSSGLDGVVASAKEVPAIRRALGDDFVIVTPGIRPEWAAADDQKRIVTPGQAMELGSDYIVVGRPITRAADKRDAARRIVEEMEAVR